MSLPKEPRAAMIQMMYLVLTAMLALNITKEVLNAFGTINNSIVRSNDAIAKKNTAIYDGFNNLEKQEDTKDKVKDINALAKQVQAETQNLVAYLGSWKDSVIAYSGGYETKEDGTQAIKNIENIDASPEIFIERGNGDKVKQALNDYRAKILDIIKDPNAKSTQTEIDLFNNNFPVYAVDMPKTEDNPKGDWTFGTFNNIPVVAAVSMFSKFQNDVKNGEAMVLEHLKSKVGIDDYTFDKLQAIATVNQGYALEGQELEAKILLAAYNSTVNPSISSSAGAVKVENGVGTLKFKASGVGERKVTGKINITKGGKVETYDYDFAYVVGTAGASLQLDAMNVMYIGVDNPVTISASGYNIQDVSLGVPAGVSAKRGEGGTYVVNVTKQGEFDYSINAKRGGSTAKISGGKIRVKRIPDPNVTLMGKNQGTFASNRIKVQRGLSARLDDFVFDLPFRVTEFEIYIVPRGGDVIQLKNKGALFSADVRAALQKVKAGDQVIFSGVKVLCPDQTIRSGNALPFQII